MININSEIEFEEFIKINDAALVYFSTSQCNVCKVLKPKVIEFIHSNYPKIKTGFVNSENLQQVAAQNSIFTVPTLLLFLDGKEFLRKSRKINFAELYDEIFRPYSMFFEN